MTEKAPRRKISEFKIPKKAKEDLQMVSKITGMLAENPKLLERIGKTMQELSKEYELKIKKEVSKVIASAVDIDPDKIIGICPDIIRFIRWYTPRVTIPPIHTPIWGPYEY